MAKLSNIFKQSSSHRATVGELVIAESDATERVEGNHYFPAEAVRWDYLEPSDHTTVCPWKGVANYYDVIVDGERLRNAAWTYKTPSSAAEQIRDHVAFWRGVRVV